MGNVEFINDNKIHESLTWGKEHARDMGFISDILTKAKECKGLTEREVACLLHIPQEYLEELYHTAREIKQKIYGNRIVMFAPLYLSNYCINGCTYCPYHRSNCAIKRKKLTQEEIKAEVTALQDMGHKRLALEAGEDPKNSPLEYILESIETIYGVHHKNGAIRRVNVNIAATSVENYRRLKAADIGTYILFQETYHRPSYEKYHKSGPKADYAYHTMAMSRAQEGGIDDVGFGVLFGLHDFRYEVMAMMSHANYLEATTGVGPHTISVPRIRPADSVDLNSFPHAVGDDDFKLLTAVLRLAVPYTGMIVSTRESEKSRREILEIGVSQISGASSTKVGGYRGQDESEDTAQFEIDDNRTLDEIVGWLLNLGYMPSFCTACYREGRTGDRFMSLAKSGQIANICGANALLTLNEYLQDYASKNTASAGDDFIAKELKNIPDDGIRTRAEGYLKKISSGERDFRF